MHTTAPQSEIDSDYAWFRLAITMLLGMIGGVGTWAVVVVLPAVQAEFGVARADASMPYTATMVGFAVGNLAVGRAIDRFGFWRPAVATAVLLGVGFLLASRSTSILEFSLIQGGMIGFGAAAIFGPAIADISHWFVKRRGVAVAGAAAGNYIAGAFWPLVMPYTMAFGGWRFTYAAIGVACLVTMIPLALLLRRPAPMHAGIATGRADGGGANFSPAVLQALLVIAGLGCCIAMSMPQVHIVAYCADLGYGVARGAEMLSVMLAAGVVSRLASGFIADRIGPLPTLIAGSVLQCISLFLYLPFDGLVSLYVVSLVFGLSQGGIVPCYALIVRQYMPAAEAGRRVGVVVMSTIIGMALGGWMSGWIYDQTGSYAAAFANGIAWNLLNVAIATLLLWRLRPPAAVSLA